MDPARTNPQFYTVIFENNRVRVLEYRDQPGDATTPHAHPDSIMLALTSFNRRLVHGDDHRDVAIDAGTVRWLDAQQHHGENIGETPSHSIFVELKEGNVTPGEAALGPT